MKFRRKIGLAFLLLISLTVVTGTIGLLFINRVLNAYGAVSFGADSSGVDLAGLNRQVHRAALISQEIDYDKEIDDILQLRREFTQTVQDFDRSFNKIRRGIEDEMYLGTLERFKEEEHELEEKTNELIDVIIEELKAEHAYYSSLVESEDRWRLLVSALAAATNGIAEEVNAAMESTGPVGVVGRQQPILSTVGSLNILQQCLLEIRLKLREYLSNEEITRVSGVAQEIEDLHRRITILGADLTMANESDRIQGLLSQVITTYNSWSSGILGERGLIELYREAVALKIRTDILIERTRSEVQDTLRTLDTVVAMSARLLANAEDRGFITAAPILLVATIGATTVLSLVLAIVLSHAIARPVKQLIRATEAVREGVYSRQLEIASGDEFADLGGAFNRMVREIKRSQAEIRSLNADLEQRVQERTAELEEEIRQRERAEEEMRQKQEQLIQASKLASLGVLVAGVAHEINNPNQAVMLGAQLVQKTWPDIRTVLDAYYKREGDFLLGGVEYSQMRVDLGAHFSGIVESARRVDGIVQSLKDFARQDKADMSETVNLNLIVKSSLILLESMTKKATNKLDVKLLPKIPTFHGNAQRIEQVVVNLVQNACQASTERSQMISISTDYDIEGDQVILEVRDQGEGIPLENQRKIFDPFFTTKRELGGTGLGLSVTSSIVREHHGVLELHSEPGKGTNILVRFPVHVERRG